MSKSYKVPALMDLTFLEAGHQQSLKAITVRKIYIYTQVKKERWCERALLNAGVWKPQMLTLEKGDEIRIEHQRVKRSEEF